MPTLGKFSILDRIDAWKLRGALLCRFWLLCGNLAAPILG